MKLKLAEWQLEGPASTMIARMPWPVPTDENPLQYPNPLSSSFLMAPDHALALHKNLLRQTVVIEFHVSFILNRIVMTELTEHRNKIMVLTSRFHPEASK